MTQHSNHHHLGHRVGPRVAKVVSDAMAAHLHDTQGMRAMIGGEALNHFFRGVNAEIRGTTSPIVREIANHPELRPEYKPLMDFMVRAPGEWSAMLHYGLMGGALSGGLGTVFQNSFAKVAQSLVRTEPELLLPWQTYAEAAVRGFTDRAHAHDNGAGQGINNIQMDMAIQLAYTELDVTALIELSRRGLLSNDELTAELHRLGYRDHTIDHIFALRSALLSPADLAEMVVKGILSEEDASARAAHVGVSEANFALLARESGEPPGVMQLLEAYRRGFIDKPRLEHGIRQSRLRSEWIDVVEHLRYSPMSVSDAARGVVQNHLTMQEGSRYAEENGLQPGHFDIIVANNGNPPGPHEMLDLYNRGAISLSTVRQSLRESHLKDKYIDDLIALHRRLIPPRTITAAVTRGTISHKLAASKLIEAGYSADDATILIDTASSGKTVRERDLAKSDIFDLYLEYAISHDVAHEMLVGLGYSSHEVSLLLGIADFRRAKSDVDNVISKLRSLYIAYHLDWATVHNDLGRLGVPSERTARIETLWNLERLANRKSLTEAQIVHAFKKGVFNAPTAHTKLVQLGYASDDADVLLEAA